MARTRTRPAVNWMFEKCNAIALSFVPAWGHSHPCDRADQDTNFISLKSVYLNPKSNCAWSLSTWNLFHSSLVFIYFKSITENLFLFIFLLILRDHLKWLDFKMVFSALVQQLTVCLIEASFVTARIVLDRDDDSSVERVFFCRLYVPFDADDIWGFCHFMRN